MPPAFAGDVQGMFLRDLRINFLIFLLGVNITPVKNGSRFLKIFLPQKTKKRPLAPFRNGFAHVMTFLTKKHLPRLRELPEIDIDLGDPSAASRLRMTDVSAPMRGRSGSPLRRRRSC